MRHLEQSAAQHGVTDADLTDLVVSSVYSSPHNGVTHVNVNQRYQGREVFGAYATVNIADGKVLYVGDSLVRGLDAQSAAAPDVDAPLRSRPPAEGSTSTTPPLSGSSTSPRAGPRRPFSPEQASRRLRYPHASGWHSAKSRAATRVAARHRRERRVASVERDRRREHGEAARGSTTGPPRTPEQELATTLARGPAPVSAPPARAPTPNPVRDGSRYRVFKHPAESPNDRGRTTVEEPADAMGSPFGWHDTDGRRGPELTTTQGNNVHAYTDRDANDIPDPDSDPNGGSRLRFDFPMDLDEHPSTYTDAATTNLFYWNNFMHDVTYRYGFDEAAGNFQVNNYRRGGVGGDQVRAEALDGSGDSNANFSTPLEDGTGVPRMQMYLWSGQQFGLPNQVSVNSGSASGTYAAQYAMFTPAPKTSAPRRNMVLVNDAVGNPSDGCQPHSCPPARSQSWIARPRVSARSTRRSSTQRVLVPMLSWW